MNFLLLAIALLISCTAGFYSVSGLVSIFSGAVWSIAIMGTVLELGKISVTVWLHRYWSETTIWLKSYLLIAIVVLMSITSLGIFGYLSRAHVGQSLKSSNAQSKISIYEVQIDSLKNSQKENQKTLQQLDDAINQVVAKSQNELGAAKALQLRNAQQKERLQLEQLNQEYQQKIDLIKQEEEPTKLELQKNEVDVGPIKYIAALIYGDNPSQNLLERAVRWVIVLLVIVFDPLAISMLLAADQQLSKDDKNEIVDDIKKRKRGRPKLNKTNQHNTMNWANKQQLTLSGKNFGPILPDNAENNSLFILTSSIPGILYKYNVKKGWVEIDKDKNSEYITDEYVNFLIKKLASNSMSVNQLTSAESIAVEKNLTK